MHPYRHFEGFTLGPHDVGIALLLLLLLHGGGASNERVCLFMRNVAA